jgi:hypothetical protein
MTLFAWIVGLLILLVPLWGARRLRGWLEGLARRHFPEAYSSERRNRRP